MSAPRRRLRGLVALSALLLGASVLTACDNGDDLPGKASADDTAQNAAGDSGTDSGDSGDSSDEPDAPAATMSTNVKKKNRATKDFGRTNIRDIDMNETEVISIES